jgi:hypothetical protein
MDIFHQTYTPDPEPDDPKPCSQLAELPGRDFEDIFVCHIDESAGLKKDAA